MVLSPKTCALVKKLIGTDGEVKGYPRTMKFIYMKQ